MIGPRPNLLVLLSIEHFMIKNWMIEDNFRGVEGTLNIARKTMREVENYSSGKLN